jgi:hypothetical protein
MGHPAVVAGLAKAIVGFARPFRPTYALANVGHPSCSREFCQDQALRDRFGNQVLNQICLGLGHSLTEVAIRITM